MTFNIIGSILPEVTIAVAICNVILVNSLLRNASVTLIHSLVLFFLSFALFLSFVSYSHSSLVDFYSLPKRLVLRYLY